MENATGESVDTLTAEKLIERKPAAAYLTGEGYPIKPGTLQKLASVGGGPPYQLFGNKALYRPSLLLKWARERTGPLRVSTSQVVDDPNDRVPESQGDNRQQAAAAGRKAAQ